MKNENIKLNGEKLRIIYSILMCLHVCVCVYAIQFNAVAQQSCASSMLFWNV